MTALCFTFTETSIGVRISTEDRAGGDKPSGDTYMTRLAVWPGTMLTTNPFEPLDGDTLHEECGIFGI